MSRACGLGPQGGGDVDAGGSPRRPATRQREPEQPAEHADPQCTAHRPDEDDRAGRRAATAPGDRVLHGQDVAQRRRPEAQADHDHPRQEQRIRPLRPRGPHRQLDHPEAIRTEPITAVRRNPKRTTTAATIATLIDHIRNSGVIVRPALVAEPPRTPCTNSGMYVSIPNSRARRSGSCPRSPRRRAARRRGRSVRSGRPLAAPDGRTSTSRTTAPADQQLARRARRRPRRSGLPAGSSVEPADSSCAPTSRSAGPRARSTSRGRAARGSRPRPRERHRHEEDPAPREPVGQLAAQPGPGQARHAPDGAEQPWTRARSSSVNRSPSIVSTIGPTAPAPSPWMHPHGDQLAACSATGPRASTRARTARGRTAARACARAGRRACRRAAS